MHRSMMQIFVKNSIEAAKFYQKAFDAELKCEYKNDDGSYMHAELDAYGQILAISESTEDVIAGNTMMFCFHFGEGGEDKVRKAYEVLKDGAKNPTAPAPCSYSPCEFTLVDKFGIWWGIFV